jgi:glycosyltransferase involved in cell wall biosynthesis
MNAPPRRLLVVAPAFPPHPTPAAHRARFLARHAHLSGWEVRVISVDPTFYAERPDLELLSLLPPELNVKRVRALPLSLARRLGFGDLSIRSLPFVLRAVGQACRTWRPDMVFVSAPPFFTFIAALAARHEFGVPYVLDYTDPWIYPLPAAERSLWSRAYWMNCLALLAEPAVARSAAHILAVSDATHTGLRSRQPRLPAERFSAIPIGFELMDFATLREHARPNSLWDSREGQIHIVHPGAISPSGHDTVRALLRGALLFRSRNRDRGEAVRIHFIGTSYAPTNPAPIVIPIARETGASGFVTERPARIPYIDALNAMVHADVVLALGSAQPHYTASKIYNCIAAGRPVLAICHEETHSIREAVEATAAGRVVTYDSSHGAEHQVESIAAALDELTRPGVTGATPESLAALAPFSAKSMSAAVFAIFDRVLNAEQAGASAA